MGLSEFHNAREHSLKIYENARGEFGVDMRENLDYQVDTNRKEAEIMRELLLSGSIPMGTLSSELAFSWEMPRR